MFKINACLVLALALGLSVWEKVSHKSLDPLDYGLLAALGLVNVAWDWWISSRVGTKPSPPNQPLPGPGHAGVRSDPASWLLVTAVVCLLSFLVLAVYRKEIHALAVKSSRSARRGKGLRSPKNAGPRPLSRASLKSS